MDFKFLSGEDVVVGRKKEQLEEFGLKGAGFLGRVVMSAGEKPVLGRRVFIDLANPHVVLILGKRGYGKSYTLGVILEEFARQPYSVKSRTSVIVVDTVGIFWTMKFPNKEQRELLEQWGIQPQGIDVQNLVPKRALPFYMEHGLPVDGYFSINPADMGPEEWLTLFDLSLDDEAGALLAGAVEAVRERKGGKYGIDDLIDEVRASGARESVKQAVLLRLLTAKGWELFDENGPRITEYVKPGKITIFDVSTLRGGLGTRALREVFVALIGKRLFEERMKYRKVEEAARLEGKPATSEMPLVWMVIDEAHLFMPSDRESISRRVLSDWIRVGRQPGLCLILATQRVERLDEDAITQADIIIAHRITSMIDIRALSKVRPTYVSEGLDKHLARLPHTRGLAVLLDDITEKLWLIQVRPRMSWHGGGSATALIRL